MFFKREKIILLIKNLFIDKKNHLLILSFFLYLTCLIVFFDSEKESLLGNGFIHKISILMFKNQLYETIFVYFSFFVSWLIILIYFNKDFKDYPEEFIKWITKNKNYVKLVDEFKIKIFNNKIIDIENLLLHVYEIVNTINLV